MSGVIVYAGGFTPESFRVLANVVAPMPDAPDDWSRSLDVTLNGGSPDSPVSVNVCQTSEGVTIAFNETEYTPGEISAALRDLERLGAACEHIDPTPPPFGAKSIAVHEPVADPKAWLEFAAFKGITIERDEKKALHTITANRGDHYAAIASCHQTNGNIHTIRILGAGEYDPYALAVLTDPTYCADKAVNPCDIHPDCHWVNISIRRAALNDIQAHTQAMKQHPSVGGKD